MHYHVVTTHDKLGHAAGRASVILSPLTEHSPKVCGFVAPCFGRSIEIISLLRIISSFMTGHSLPPTSLYLIKLVQCTVIPGVPVHVMPIWDLLDPTNPCDLLVPT